MDILEELKMLGGLGIQYCVKTEKAYSKLSEIKEEMISVNYLEFNRRYNERDICARENMKQLINYFQWYYNISSKRVLELVPLDFIKAAYHGLHDLDLELAERRWVDRLQCNQVICFHNPEEENGYLSNWYRADFIMDGITFSSMEQYMMYQECGRSSCIVA